VLCFFCSLFLPVPTPIPRRPLMHLQALTRQHAEMHRLFQALAKESWWKEYRRIIANYANTGGTAVSPNFALATGMGGHPLWCKVSRRPYGDSHLQFFHGENYLCVEEAVDVLLHPGTCLYAANPRRVLVNILLEVQTSLSTIQMKAEEVRDSSVLQTLSEFETMFYPRMRALLKTYQATSWENYNIFGWILRKFRALF